MFAPMQKVTRISNIQKSSLVDRQRDVLEALRLVGVESYQQSRPVMIAGSGGQGPAEMPGAG
jgi:hypothetical protein